MMHLSANKDERTEERDDWPWSDPLFDRPQRHRPPAKWAPGEPVASIEEFLALCQSRSFFWIGPIDGRHRGRAVHSGWAMNRPFALTVGDIARGNIRRVVVSAAYAEWIAAEHASLTGGAA